MSVTSYIQGHDVSTLKSHQSRTAAKQADYLLPHILSSSQILDVGCGPGTITCDFAQLAPLGSVIGIDYSTEVLESARTEASKRRLSNITFQNGSAHELPFSDNTFDIVHCHAVLIHLPRPQEALREMRRVCKPNGYVAAREPDWETCVIHPHSDVLQRWKQVQAQMKRNEGAEPNAGRWLAEWAVGVGFEPDKVTVASDVLLYAGREGVKWWGELYASRMGTEFGKRAIETGVATQEDIDAFREAYVQWSKSDTGVWAMMHMKLLCQK